MKSRYLLLLFVLMLTFNSCWKMDNPLDPEVTPITAIAKPSFYPPGGSYTQNQNVLITCATSGVTIRYTTNGSEPTSNSAVYSSAVSVSGAATLKAKAFKTGWPESQTATASYTFQTATPTFSIAGGIYFSNQFVVITCDTNGATIRYTTNGSEPTSSSAVYSSYINVSAATTLKAKAFKTGWPDSQTAAASYTFQTATPEFSPAGGIYFSNPSVAITCATSGATIRYTTNGSIPTSSSEIYSSAISVSAATTLHAKAFKSGWWDSQTATASYVINPSYFVFVQGGTFHNGTSNVTLSSFYIDKYEVTQAGYQAVMGTNPSYFTGNPNRPVEWVSWFNAIEYCNRLSIQEGRTPCYSYGTYGTNPDYWPTGWNSSNANHTYVSCNWTANGYRLPTEMEWMYAAKGGNQSQGYTYSGSNTIDNVAWYSSNSSDRTHDVGELDANELGIFDMSGNVWEWVWDIYGTYPSGNQTNPTGPVSGSINLLRGGSFPVGANDCSVSSRIKFYVTDAFFHLGFRVLRNSP